MHIIGFIDAAKQLFKVASVITFPPAVYGSSGDPNPHSFLVFSHFILDIMMDVQWFYFTLL